MDTLVDGCQRGDALRTADRPDELRSGVENHVAPVPAAACARSVESIAVTATSAPEARAIARAATSACCAASPPCLKGTVVASPAPKALGTPRIAPVASTGMYP